MSHGRMLDKDICAMNPTNIGNIEAVLGQIRNYQAELEAGYKPSSSAANIGLGTKPDPNRLSFPEAVKGAVQAVNGAAMNSKMLRSAYEHGEDVPLTDVVIGMQKSSLAFEATLQIRNKVLKAYEDILHMPV